MVSAVNKKSFSKSVATGDLVVDSRLQTRAKESRETVEAYIEVYQESSAAYPFAVPIEVVKVGGRLHVVDGRHRLAAAIRHGVQKVLCNIVEGQWEDAVRAACRANRTHGLQRTTDDKISAVETAFRELGLKATDKAVAELCGVSRYLVDKVRSDKFGEQQPQTRVGRDGKERPAKTPRKAKQVIATTANEVQVQDKGPSDACPVCTKVAWSLYDDGYRCECGHYHGEPAAVDDVTEDPAIDAAVSALYEGAALKKSEAKPQQDIRGTKGGIILRGATPEATKKAKAAFGVVLRYLDQAGYSKDKEVQQTMERVLQWIKAVPKS